jgi:long-chain acyl-CoA synthetase
MNLVHLLLRSARWQPERPALAVGKRPVRTYRAMASRVARLASGFQTKGLKKNDRIALAMKNCPEFYEVLFACWHSGMTAVPMNAKLHPKEFAYILENSGAKLCFVTPDLQQAVPSGIGVEDALGETESSPVDVDPDDVAWLFYTSGTTGVPKGAMLTHRNMLFQTHAYFADIDKLAPGDSALHPAPLSHGSGLYGLPHFAAGAVNVIPESGHFEPAEIFELLDHWPNASFFAAPTMLVRLMAAREARTPKNLKTITYGGAPMYVADCLRAIELFGPRLFQLFGQGEAPMTITGLPQEFHRERKNLETCGYARTGCEVKILDDHDRELPPGEAGEIVTRSDCVMKGYWQNPEATAKAKRGGWLHTGDVGSLDAAGFLTIMDRSKDLIISGGANIYPREIEEVLLRHPEVAECSVVGRPHAEWGEEVVAFIVKRNAVDTGELDNLCLDNIARFKRPREYRFVEALPKNNYGKVLKTELRKLLTAGTTHSPAYSADRR